MKKVILIYGLIAGTIVAGMMLITMPMYKDGNLDMDNGELVGYTTMVIALSMVFFGVKSYRDQYLHGVISFWRAFKVGILITAVASLMYALAWEMVYPNLGDDVMQKITAQHFEEMQEDGATGAEIQAERKKWNENMEMYKDPVIRFGITLMEIFPVGFVITLLSAALLRNKEFLPTTQ